MNKFMTLWTLIAQGRMVADPVFWKKMQAVGQPALASVFVSIVALLKGTKYEIEIDDATLALIAGGIFAAVNWVLTHITTTKDIRVLPIVNREDPVPESQPASETRADVPVVNEATVETRQLPPSIGVTLPKPIIINQPDPVGIPDTPIDPNLYRGG
jgi:hypothetical protein